VVDTDFYLHMHLCLLTCRGRCLLQRVSQKALITGPACTPKSLEFNSLSVENVLQLGSLSRLQVLCFSAAGDVAVGPRSAPSLLFPTSLTMLVLSSPIEAGLLSLVPTGLQDLRLKCDVEGPAVGPSSFLSGMDRLQHLTSLSVEANCGLDWPLACPAYSALTASSSLVHLAMLDTAWPEGIWPYVFPSQRTLPHLATAAFHVQQYHNINYAAPAPPWGARDLVSLVNCCPSLRQVSALPLQHGLHVAELHKLTGLDSLHVKYDAGDLPAVNGSLKGLASLTHLRVLDVALDGHILRVSSLLPLTSHTSGGSYAVMCSCGWCS
jgi:hypothetical protein